MTYDHAIQHSAQQYIGHLKVALRGSLTSATRAAAQAALDTTEAALAGKRVELEGVVLDLELVRHALAKDQDAPSVLINECTPGLGARKPLAVFVGKETAYDAALPLNFMLESIALTALWLAEPNSASMVAAMTRQRGVSDFLRVPGQLYPAVKGGHTWYKIGSVMSQRTGQLVGPLGWGHSAYLVELGAVPSRNHAGHAPTPRRIAFLQLLVRGFANDGVRNLVLHSQERHHNDAQQALVSAFLSVDRGRLDSLRRLVRTGPSRSHEIEQWEIPGRRALRCRNLSNSISKKFLSDLSNLLL